MDPRTALGGGFGGLGRGGGLCSGLYLFYSRYLLGRGRGLGGLGGGPGSLGLTSITTAKTRSNSCDIRRRRRNLKRSRKPSRPKDRPTINYR